MSTPYRVIDGVEGLGPPEKYASDLEGCVDWENKMASRQTTENMKTRTHFYNKNIDWV